MSSTGSPDRCTSANTSTDTPSPTTAAWPRRRRRKGSASGLHVGVPHPDEVVGADLEALDPPGDARELLELPEEHPDRLVVQPPEGLDAELLAPLGVEGLLVVPDGLEQVARRVEVAERGELRLEA